ncbi:MAG: hypothetical protein O3C61_03305 [Proteobacteria bacterium]|nr:hypothetical protein [Pseudomonadota bacterium]
MFKYFFLLIYSFSVFAHHSEHATQATEPYPVIWISDYQDNDDGHNIKIHLENFIFAPEKITYKASGNEGYIVITVNDIPIGRAYSDWFHIPQRFITLDTNVVKVTLKTYDHYNLTIGDEVISKEITIDRY